MKTSFELFFFVFLFENNAAIMQHINGAFVSEVGDTGCVKFSHFEFFLTNFQLCQIAERFTLTNQAVKITTPHSPFSVIRDDTKQEVILVITDVSNITINSSHHLSLICHFLGRKHVSFKHYTVVSLSGHVEYSNACCEKYRKDGFLNVCNTNDTMLAPNSTSVIDTKSIFQQNSTATTIQSNNDIQHTSTDSTIQPNNGSSVSEEIKYSFLSADTFLFVLLLLSSFLLLLIVLISTFCFIKKRCSKSDLEDNRSLVASSGTYSDTKCRISQLGRDCANCPQQKQQPPAIQSINQLYDCGLSSDGSLDVEFPRAHLHGLYIIGSGCFGEVWKYEIIDPHDKLNKQIVAVKTLKSCASVSDRDDILNEIEVMCNLRKNMHVVQMIGYCTSQDPILLILEFVGQGSLQNHLRNLTLVDSEQIRFMGDQLMRFGLQIATGMRSISEQKIVHRDLATRNVLLTDDFVCKISDFGLARFVNSDHVYQRKSNGKLPIRWTAPECLKRNQFSEMSDAWSFGILLWEIVTLGSTPYSDMTVEQVISFVDEGHRLEKPSHCSRELYNLMYYCWSDDIESRPTFVEVCQILEAGLSRRKQYIDIECFTDRCYYEYSGSEERM